MSSVTRRTPPEPLPPRPPIPLSYLVLVEREIRGEEELGRHRQLAIVSDLRSKLGTRESSGARELLQALRERPDVTFEVATTVDELLATPDPEPERVPVAAVPAARPQDKPVRRTEPAPTAPAAPTTPPPAAPRGAAPHGRSRLATSLGLTGALAAFLSLSIVPWATEESDSRVWVGFSVVFSAPNRDAVELGGWVTGLVFSAGVAAILVVLVAALSGTVSAGPRIAAAVGAVLVTVLGFAATRSFADPDAGWHMSVGPWLLAVGAVLIAFVLLKPSIGGQRSGSAES